MRSLARSIVAAVAALPLAAAAQGRGRTELTWWGQSAFVLRTPGGTVLAIDPWLSNPRSPDEDAAQKLEKVDYVLVTHGHPDHVGEAIAIAKRTGAKLVASSDLGRALVALGYPKEQAGMDTLGNAGGEIRAGDATIVFVPAVHSSDVAGPSGPIPGGNPLGFVIRVKGGPTIYDTGDTDAFSDMRLVAERYGPIDVMLACIGGHFTMDPRGAALAARLVRPKRIVPMHYGTFPALTGTPEELAAALHGAAKVLELVPGRPTAL